MRLVIALPDAVPREIARRVASAHGFETIAVCEGRSAKAVLTSEPPAIGAVVDVALPELLGYELCDFIRGRGLPTEVIFVASVYSATAYKRRPAQLYGAVDYVEQHHLGDLLGGKLARWGGVAPAEPVNLAGLIQQQSDEADRRLLFDSSARVEELVRIIAADVAMYDGGAHEIADLPERCVAAATLLLAERSGVPLAESRRLLAAQLQHMFEHEQVRDG